MATPRTNQVFETDGCVKALPSLVPRFRHQAPNEEARSKERHRGIFRDLVIYIPGPHWFIRPNNTDWRYTQMLCRFGDFDKSLIAVPERSWAQLIETNLRFVLGAVAGRLHLRLPNFLIYGLAQYRSLSRRELMSIKPDVIFAYERYPRWAPAPVLWMTGPIPEQQVARKNRSAINKEIAWKQKCANNAARVICSTAFAKDAFCSQTGFSRERVLVIPFLLPHLAGGGAPKQGATENGRLQCLFVGRDAIRKGLPRALRIFRHAPDHWSLHVISNFADGPVELPDRVTHQKTASRDEVLAWMSKSDLLFSLSEFDSFGFAAVEAASRQCMPVFRAGSIQETMFSSVAALFLDDESSPQSCVGAIEDKLTIQRQSTRRALLSEFRQKFSPEIVTATIYSLALEAVLFDNRSSLHIQPSNDLESTYSEGYTIPQVV